MIGTTKIGVLRTKLFFLKELDFIDIKKRESRKKKTGTQKQLII